MMFVSRIATSPERPKSPRESNISKGLNSIKRTLSKSKILTEVETEGPSSTKVTTQTQPRRSTDTNPARPARPLSAAYIPTDAASDFSKIGDQRKPLPQPPSERPETPVYVPKHAATDLPRMNLKPKDQIDSC
jgi:hypothetical protein